MLKLLQEAEVVPDPFYSISLEIEIAVLSSSAALWEALAVRCPRSDQLVQRLEV